MRDAARKYLAGQPLGGELDQIGVDSIFSGCANPFGLASGKTRPSFGPTEVNIDGVSVPLVLLRGNSAELEDRHWNALKMVASRLSTRGIGTAAQIAAQLTDARWALLGPREVIRPYRQSSVQWNPADDLCLAAEVVVDPQPTAHGEWELSGTVFGLP